MSVDAGLSMVVVGKNGPRSILDALLASRWQRHEEGWWCVALDEDPSEWALLASEHPSKLLTLFQEKMAAQQAFGVRLWWEGGEVGGEFLLFPSCEVVFSPSMNRVIVGDRTTDVTWYLTRLLPVFRSDKEATVESWTWRETT
jgi:hypothetical protein